ncbi:MAG: hypothetical protein LC650_01570 [Actinobacteria bacterium]|nr:hypothetical protein [Actinomycetota bacterium]
MLITDGAIQTFETLLSLGSPALLLVMIVLLLRGDLITKGQHSELERDRDTWQEIAMEAINLSMAAVGRRENEEQ